MLIKEQNAEIVRPFWKKNEHPTFVHIAMLIEYLNSKIIEYGIRQGGKLEGESDERTASAFIDDLVFIHKFGKGKYKQGWLPNWLTEEQLYDLQKQYEVFDPDISLPEVDMPQGFLLTDEEVNVFAQPILDELERKEQEEEAKLLFFQEKVIDFETEQKTWMENLETQRQSYEKTMQNLKKESITKISEMENKMKEMEEKYSETQIENETALEHEKKMVENEKQRVEELGKAVEALKGGQEDKIKNALSNLEETQKEMERVFHKKELANELQEENLKQEIIEKNKELEEEKRENEAYTKFMENLENMTEKATKDEWEVLLRTNKMISEKYDMSLFTESIDVLEKNKELERKNKSLITDFRNLSNEMDELKNKMKTMVEQGQVKPATVPETLTYDKGRADCIKEYSTQIGTYNKNLNEFEKKKKEFEERKSAFRIQLDEYNKCKTDLLELETNFNFLVEDAKKKVANKITNEYELKLEKSRQTNIKQALSVKKMIDQLKQCSEYGKQNEDLINQLEKKLTSKSMIDVGKRFDEIKHKFIEKIIEKFESDKEKEIKKVYTTTTIEPNQLKANIKRKINFELVPISIYHAIALKIAHEMNEIKYLKINPDWLTGELVFTAKDESFGKPSRIARITKTNVQVPHGTTLARYIRYSKDDLRPREIRDKYWRKDWFRFSLKWNVYVFESSMSKLFDRELYNLMCLNMMKTSASLKEKDNWFLRGSPFSTIRFNWGVPYFEMEDKTPSKKIFRRDKKGQLFENLRRINSLSAVINHSNKKDFNNAYAKFADAAVFLGKWARGFSNAILGIPMAVEYAKPRVELDVRVFFDRIDEMKTVLGFIINIFEPEFKGLKNKKLQRKMYYPLVKNLFGITPISNVNSPQKTAEAILDVLTTNIISLSVSSGRKMHAVTQLHNVIERQDIYLDRLMKKDYTFWIAASYVRAISKERDFGEVERIGHHNYKVMMRNIGVLKIF
jgi:hypothetical protein